MTEYPEARPAVERIERFTANFRVALEHKAEMVAEADRLETEIDQRVKETVIGGGPVLAPLLNLTQDPEDLTMLADALTFVAERIGRFNQLRKRLEVVEMAEKEPEWMMATFGEFDDMFRDLTVTDATAEPPPLRRRNPLEL